MSYDYSLPPGVPVGYVQSSPLPQPWSGTMWTRDAAVFLRECVMWGALDDAAATAKVLIDLAPLNSLGFYAYPGRFDLLQPDDASLSEVDASASIFIAAALLWQRLPPSHDLHQPLSDFLLGNRSIVRGFKAQLAQQRLVQGSGEFGGGAFTPGLWINVAQNAFVAAAFDAAAAVSCGCSNGDSDWSAEANALRSAMLEIMTNDTTSGWYWAVNATTMKPDPTVTSAEVNIGFGGLNGPLTYMADVGLVLPLQLPALAGREQAVLAAYVARCIATFDALLAVPSRALLFREYGIWTQFDTFRGGHASGPSYGQGYALQALLLMDRLDEAGNALRFLTNVTYNNGSGWGQFRSALFLYEQFFAPPVPGMAKLGCGELNVVSVMEPLKVSRLILGITDWVAGNVSVVPRLPPQWYSSASPAVVTADDWPVLVAQGAVARVGIIYMQNSSGSSFSIAVARNDIIPLIYVRMFSGRTAQGQASWCWVRASNVTQWTVTSDDCCADTH